MKDTREVVYRPAFTERDLQEVLDLVAGAEKKEVRYKIDPGINRGILCRRNDVLTGFMTVDYFGGDEVESAAIADSEADWVAMADVLAAFAKEKTGGQILFIADPGDTLVKNKLESMGLRPSFAEYRMTFEPERFAPVAIRNVSIRPSAPADHDYILSLDKEEFGGAINQISERDRENTFLIQQGGRPVGKLRVDKIDGVCGIYGVVVESQLRGQGIGGQAMTLILKKLLEQRARSIYLEVESENAAAFSLYKKLGFRIASEFQYYPWSAVSG